MLSLIWDIFFQEIGSDNRGLQRYSQHMILLDLHQIYMYFEVIMHTKRESSINTVYNEQLTL